MRIDSAQLTNASISGSFSGSITSTAEQPIVSGSSQVVLSATTGFGTYSASVATYTDAKVADLVDSSPGALDTLNELAAALGDDSNFSASLATSVGNRLPTATFNTYSSSAAGAVRTEYVAAVSTLSGSAHTQRVAISASLDATIDALDSLGVSTDTERGALSGSAHAQRVIEKNIAAGLVTSLTNGAVASNTTTAGAALPKAGGAMTGAITTNSTFDGRDVATDGTKLDAIEASATADQTNDEIKAAVEAASDSNTFTDADHSKLNAIEASADVTDATNVTAAGALMDSEVTNLADVKEFDTTDYATAAQGTLAASAQQPPSEGAFANGDKTKLDAIEASADVTDTTNVTAAGALMDSEVTDLAGVKGVTISTLQAKPSEGAFANGDKTKLDAIEGSATADQTNDEIKAAVEAASDSNTFTDADHSKLNAIEASATADQTNDEIIAAVVAKTDISSGDKGTIRSNIGVDTAGTDNSTNVSLGGSLDYVTLSGQVLTRNAIDLTTDVTGTLPVGNMAATALTTVQTAADQTAHLALTTEEGDVVVRTDEGKTYMHNGGSAGNMNDFTLLATPTDAVASVNGGTGVVTVTENVTTNLSITGTTGARTIVSSDGTDAIIPIATTSVSGVMSKTIFDEHVANNAKATDVNHNVSTNLSATTATGQITINSSDGDNVVIGEATATIAGLMSTTHHDKLDGIEASATADQTAAQIRTLVGTGNSNFVPSAGTAGHFLKHDGTFGLPSYTTNTDTNTQNSAAEIRTKVGTGNSGVVPAAGTAGHFLKHDGTFGLPSYTTNTDTNTQRAIHDTPVDGATTTSISSNWAHDNVRLLSNGGQALAGSFTATGDITAYSDESLKKDVSTIEGALDKTKALRGVEFTRIADEKRSIGVIAQELETVLPELVLTDSEGIKSVNYAQITGLLIEAVKELSAKVDELSK